MKLFKNFVYDIKAIRKYGLIRHIKYLFDLNHTIVILHFNLKFIPDLEGGDEFTTKEISLEDDDAIKDWSNIINSAFNFENPFNPQTAKDYILNHSYKNIEKCYMVYEGDYAIATFFVGSFKVNNKIACAGRFAVRPEYQGKGIGKYIVIKAMNIMKQNGYRHYEETFNYWRKYSYRLFMQCGGYPEFDRKYCQLKPTRKFFLVHLWAQYNVNKMYKEVLRKRNEAFLK